MATDEWLVLLPNRCPAYISSEQYEHNQARLQANRARSDALGAARSGSALLAGLVVCARCGCRLNVHYDGGGPLHTYEYVERHTHYGETRCQHLAGPCLDTFVSQQVLAALEPAALELSLTATERVEQERAELDRI
jgi:Recombinase zinc beta ribbon domain